MAWDETGRRLAAAISYSRKTDTDISHAIGKDGPDTLRGWKKHGIPDDKRRVMIDAIAKACGLPSAFFYADFARLHEIVPAPTADALRGLDAAAADLLAQSEQQSAQTPRRRASD